MNKNGLILEYEAMSQKGMVVDFEETAFLLITDWYYKMNFYSKALAAVEDALKIHPSSLSLHLFRSQLLLESECITDAIDSIAYCQSLTDEDQRIALFRAEAFCHRGDSRSAINIINNFLYPMPSEKQNDFSLKIEKKYNELDEFEKMFDALAETAIRQPENEETLEQIWICVEAIGNYNDSQALHETILDLNPYSFFAWHNLGHAYSRLGKTEDALDAFEYSFITNSYFENGYREFAALAFSNGLYNRALQCYIEMVQYLGEDVDAFVRIGECYLRLGDTKIARAMYEKALKLDPYHAEAYFRIGECLALQKEYQNALKWLREAVRNEDRREDFHSSLSEVYYCLGKEHDALEHAWKAVEIAPDEQRYWTEVVRLYMVLGQLDDALETISSGLENVTENNELLYCRSACLFLVGNRPQAIKQLKQALTKDFSRHQALFHVAPSLANDSDIRRLIDNFHS